MARYIDADALIKKIFPYNVVDKKLYCINAQAVYNAISKTPTADVVPKAEVEELVHKLECLLCHATGGKLSYHTYPLATMERAVTDYIQECYDEAYDEAKVEVAREIFEEIEQRTKDVGFSSFAEKFEFADFIAELKKKYTGERHGKTR